MKAKSTSKPMSFDVDAEEVIDGLFPVTFTPKGSGIFRIYLFGGIQDSRQFIQAIEALSRAGPEDVVEVHLSTNGGSLDATDSFLSSMDACEARVILFASGGVHSAGSIIMMHADEFILSENFHMLIHNGSVGMGGKFSDFRAQAAFTEAYMETTMRSTYEGFLSDDEIEELLAGKDFWLEKHEFMTRWKNRLKFFQENSAEGVDTDSD